MGQGTFCPRTNCPRAYIVPGQNVPPEVCYDGGSWVFIGETFCPGGVFRGKTFCPGIRSGTFCPGGNFSTIPDQTSIFWDIFGSFGRVWDILGYSGIFWDLLGYCGIFWDIVGSFGIFWDLLGYFGIF